MPKVSANDAAIYAANDLITALTKPQPPDSFILIGDDQIVALRQLATIFQSSITKKPTSDPGVLDSAPPQRPRTRSQPKQLANAALTVPQRDQLHHNPPQTTRRNKTRGGPGFCTPRRHPKPHKASHRPNNNKFMTTISYKTRRNVGRSVPPYPIHKRSHGPGHRQATRVQTTHQSPQHPPTPNVATLECK